MNFLLLNLKTTFFRLGEHTKTLFRYYPRLEFFWIDLLLTINYFFQNPHRVHKKFLKNIDRSELFIYGETPLTTLDKIASQCGILSKDTVYELGCGPGRTAFWLTTFIRCRVIGVDISSKFIQRAERVKRWVRNDRVAFRKEDILLTDLQNASVIYLYGTCFDDPMIEMLVERFKCLKSGTKIITVSYSLTEYCENPYFRVDKTFVARFPWGKSEVYLNVRN